MQGELLAIQMTSVALMSMEMSMSFCIVHLVLIRIVVRVLNNNNRFIFQILYRANLEHIHPTQVSSGVICVRQEHSIQAT